MRFFNSIILLAALLLVAVPVSAQISPLGGTVSGNMQTDIQTYSEDTIIGAPDVAEKILMNSYANILYTNGNFTAGMRFEGYLNTLEGFDNRNDGVGVSNRFVQYQAERLNVTLGTFYEQFGNGLILRAYEDKAVDYDNALDGIRLKYTIGKGIFLKGLIARQRSFFAETSDNYSVLQHGPGIVRAIDGEIMLNETFESLQAAKTRISLGGSFVSKFQDSDLNNPFYHLPANVGAAAGRFNIQRGKVNVSSEYAYKINDPSADNNFIYKDGNAFLINATYSQKGFGVFLSAKRVDNMSFRSDRNANLNVLNINNLPVIARNHTYSLAAMYPYATQPTGEMGYRAEIMYQFPRESTLGGKYGTNLTIGFSRVTSIDKQAVSDTAAIGTAGTLGYESDPLTFGEELYFQDFNIEINKKFSRKVKMVLTYQNLVYNFEVLRGKPGHKKVYANTGIIDFTYKFTTRNALRTELQGLFSDPDQDMGSWAMILLEYTMAPHWFFSVSDQYNYNNNDEDMRVHYYSAALGYTNGGNRFQIGYGKQRSGVVCVGGVCRNMPASNGLIISVSSTF